MIVKHNDRKFCVAFNHNQEKRSTVCFVKDENGNVLSKGTASCWRGESIHTYVDVIRETSDLKRDVIEKVLCALFNVDSVEQVNISKVPGLRIPDQFNKNSGRVVSLTRAIQDFDKPTRTAFWNAYKQMRNGKIT